MTANRSLIVSVAVTAAAYFLAALYILWILNNG